MDDNIKITAEISKTEASALFFLVGEELTEEQWKKLSERPISLDWDKLDKNEGRNLKMILIGCAILTQRTQ
jgi:hypothetical protein|nr:MAG TPA: hypothetical protein [Caudoviricetes sp.]